MIEVSVNKIIARRRVLFLEAIKGEALHVAPHFV
jgi:hypothetical protein